MFSTHYSRLHRLPFVPVILGPSLTRADRSSEEYGLWCRAMLILFKPWRSIEDLKTSHKSWSSVYDAHSFPDHLQTVIQNINVEFDCQDARDFCSDKEHIVVDNSVPNSVYEDGVLIPVGEHRNNNATLHYNPDVDDGFDIEDADIMEDVQTVRVRDSLLTLVRGGFFDPGAEIIFSLSVLILVRQKMYRVIW
jgi:hypothetical protein